MTSPIATGGRYVGVSLIHARFVGIQRDPAGAHERLALADLRHRLLDELERPVVDPPGGALAKQEAAVHIGHGSASPVRDDDALWKLYGPPRRAHGSSHWRTAAQATPPGSRCSMCPSPERRIERDGVAGRAGALDVALAHRRRHDDVLLAVDEQRRDAERQPRRGRGLRVALGVLVVGRAHERRRPRATPLAGEVHRAGLRDRGADAHRRVRARGARRPPTARAGRPRRSRRSRRDRGRAARRASPARRSPRARPRRSAASRRRTSARRGGTRGSSATQPRRCRSRASASIWSAPWIACQLPPCTSTQTGNGPSSAGIAGSSRSPHWSRCGP